MGARLVAVLSLLMGAAAPGLLKAQAAPPRPAADLPALEVAFSGIGIASLQVGSGQNFGQEGGSGSVAMRVYRNLSAVAEVAGTHTGSAGSPGVPLSLVTTTFGARYRVVSTRRLSLYAEGLVGEANGFNSLFPSGTSLTSSASSLAAQAGGGLDVTVRRRFAIRALEAEWLRTQLPNGESNVQNSLRLGAGVVFRFR